MATNAARASDQQADGFRSHQALRAYAMIGGGVDMQKTLRLMSHGCAEIS